MLYDSMVSFSGRVYQHGFLYQTGTSYTGKEFKEMCQKYNIKHIT